MSFLSIQWGVPLTIVEYVNKTPLIFIISFFLSEYFLLEIFASFSDLILFYLETIFPIYIVLGKIGSQLHKQIAYICHSFSYFNLSTYRTLSLPPAHLGHRGGQPFAIQSATRWHNSVLFMRLPEYVWSLTLI